MPELANRGLIPRLRRPPRIIRVIITLERVASNGEVLGGKCWASPAKGLGINKQ